MAEEQRTLLSSLNPASALKGAMDQSFQVPHPWAGVAKAEVWLWGL